MSGSRAPPPVAVDNSMLMALGLMSVLPVASLPDSALGYVLLAIDSSIATLDVQ